MSGRLNLRELRLLIGWTRSELASRLDVRLDTIEKWEKGRDPVPLDILAWLEKIGELISKNPPPQKPVRRDYKIGAEK